MWRRGQGDVKFPHSDPRLPMLQIAKERYCRVQPTELYKMRRKPKKGRTLMERERQRQRGRGCGGIKEEDGK